MRRRRCATACIAAAGIAGTLLLALTSFAAPPTRPPRPRPAAWNATTTLERAVREQRAVTVAELFARARAAAGVAAAPTDASVARAWRRRRPTPLVVRAPRLAYVRVFKAGNDALHHHMLHVWANATAGPAVTFTFVRDPLARFASAYGEIEMRLTERCAGDAAAAAAAAVFLRAAPAARPRAFLADFLLGPGLAAYRGARAAGGESCLLREAVLEHAWPMASFVAPLRPGFVGRLETFDDDLRRLAARVGAALPWDPALGRHGAVAAERLSFEAARRRAQAALRSDAGVRRAACYLYFDDFSRFGYDVPPECRRLPVTTARGVP